MKNVLIIGSTGQIGSELTMKLRKDYPNGEIVAGYIQGAEPKTELLESGPCELCDITNAQQIADLVEKYKIDTIYNLAALLSAVAEAQPQLAWSTTCLKWLVKRAALCLRRVRLARSAELPLTCKPRRTPFSDRTRCTA